MKPALLITLILTAGFLAGCGFNAAIPVIDPSQTYRGYPCFDQCLEFSQGYNHAQTAAFSTLHQCDGINPEWRNGCRSYVTDYQVNTQNNGGLYLE